MSGLHFRHDTGFPGESRFLDGHFPGNPVVPGAVILAYLSRCLNLQGFGIARIDRMKFMRPLLPSRPFTIDVAQDANVGKVRFEDGQGVFASARIVLSEV